MEWESQRGDDEDDDDFFRDYVGEEEAAEAARTSDDERSEQSGRAKARRCWSTGDDLDLLRGTLRYILAMLTLTGQNISPAEAIKMKQAPLEMISTVRLALPPRSVPPVGVHAPLTARIASRPHSSSAPRRHSSRRQYRSDLRLSTTTCRRRTGRRAGGRCGVPTTRRRLS